VGRVGYFWTGKELLEGIISSPPKQQLVFSAEKSVNHETTDNIVIVGDNLEALKNLLTEYKETINTIYIDPPYNTGRAQTYHDDFRSGFNQVNIADQDINIVDRNTLVSDAMHAAWLNMIYPRLFIARELLHPSGVILVSIDENEEPRLRMIMDEIFGPDNFICQFVWRCRPNRSYNVKHVSIDTEYILLYCKDNNWCRINKDDEDTEEYTLVDEYVSTRGKYKVGRLDTKSRGYVPSLDFPIYHNGLVAIPGGTEAEHKKKEWRWLWNKDKVAWGLENGYIFLAYDNNGIVRAYKKYYENVDNCGNTMQRKRPYSNVIDDIFTHDGTRDISKLFDRRVLLYPKPVALIKHLLRIVGQPDDIVLDFFAGSGTTGQAVWELNQEDGGSRRFILVQLDEPVQSREPLPENLQTIADICIERLRRVSNLSGGLFVDQQAIGFKVFYLLEEGS